MARSVKPYSARTSALLGSAAAGSLLVAAGPCSCHPPNCSGSSGGAAVFCCAGCCPCGAAAAWAGPAEPRKTPRSTAITAQRERLIVIPATRLLRNTFLHGEYPEKLWRRSLLIIRPQAAQKSFPSPQLFDSAAVFLSRFPAAISYQWAQAHTSGPFPTIVFRGKLCVGERCHRLAQRRISAGVTVKRRFWR